MLVNIYSCPACGIRIYPTYSNVGVPGFTVPLHSDGGKMCEGVGLLPKSRIATSKKAGKITQEK